MTQLPMIHLNGTDGMDLAEEYGQALEALDQAIERLRAVTVHGRDYYLIGERAVTDAVSEHHGRLRKLDEVRGELALIYAHIFEQLALREEHHTVAS